MRTATLTRYTSVSGLANPFGATFGNWLSDSGLKLFSLEKPWRDNEPDVSCIPTGTYTVTWAWSPRHGKNLYQVQNVDARSGIEIHPANLEEQLLGCVALGEAIETFAAGSITAGFPAMISHGITNSITAISKMEADFRDAQGNQEDFVLVIK